MQKYEEEGVLPLTYQNARMLVTKFFDKVKLKLAIVSTVESGLVTPRDRKKSDEYAGVTNKPNYNMMYLYGKAISRGF